MPLSYKALGNTLKCCMKEKLQYYKGDVFPRVKEVYGGNLVFRYITSTGKWLMSLFVQQCSQL